MLSCPLFCSHRGSHAPPVVLGAPVAVFPQCQLAHISFPLLFQKAENAEGQTPAIGPDGEVSTGTRCSPCQAQDPAPLGAGSRLQHPVGQLNRGFPGQNSHQGGQREPSEHLRVN